MARAKDQSHAAELYQKKRPKKPKGRTRSVVINTVPEGADPKDYDRQELFCQYKAMGMSTERAHQMAGYKPHHSNAYNMYQRPEIQARIAELQKINREMADLSRKDVMAIVADAIAMARLQADPTAMLRGANELNKMLGYHMPEKVVHEIGEDSKRFVASLKNMSDEEMLEHLGDENLVVDAEFEELPGDEDVLAGFEESRKKLHQDGT